VRRVCVFCGSNVGARPVYGELAVALGQEIARRGLGLVYGGGDVGLMGVVADACLDAGGDVVGVMPEALVAKEIAHGGLTELRVVASMHERKAAMADLADGFIALPGGFGTLEEFFEVVTWTQLGVHQKPCGLLDVDGYFGPLLALIRAGRGRRVHPGPAPRPGADLLGSRRPPRPARGLGAGRAVEVARPGRDLTPRRPGVSTTGVHQQDGTVLSLHTGWCPAFPQSSHATA
jgi:uncharacterized protein (TIGR00730 family)